MDREGLDYILYQLGLNEAESHMFASLSQKMTLVSCLSPIPVVIGDNYCQGHCIGDNEE